MDRRATPGCRPLSIFPFKFLFFHFPSFSFLFSRRKKKKKKLARLKQTRVRRGERERERERRSLYEERSAFFGLREGKTKKSRESVFRAFFRHEKTRLNGRVSRARPALGPSRPVRRRLHFAFWKTHLVSWLLNIRFGKIQIFQRTSSPCPAHARYRSSPKHSVSTLSQRRRIPQL